MKAIPWPGSVPAEVTTWASSILNNPTSYPMGASALKTVGTRTAMAKVERHTWTYRDGVRITGNFRGVTIYEVFPTNIVGDKI